MKPRQTVQGEQEYVLGTNRDELVRLGLQHQLWARYAADAWERAGFGPGKKLLDIGCGPGYASLDLAARVGTRGDRKSTRLNSSHSQISYAVFCLKKKKKKRAAATEHVMQDSTSNRT